ncbi:MAG: hydantoinase B/oxoprolinase family protein [Chromatiales bacterium]|nr:hydantoinase B/oxoprolinase family protein [Chromatiales bacterium]
MDPIELSLFASRIEAVCDEMGAVLRRSAFSPNIRDRLDFSCAVFDAHGQLCAQAAHIPVHLGSMAFAMADIVGSLQWADGDVVVLNDPFLGGTHLPDVTVITPLFHGGELAAFLVNRAHHADIGASTPGSMPISGNLAEEGVVIAPVHWYRAGEEQAQAMAGLLASTRNPDETRGDFAAQVSANAVGRTRLAQRLSELGLASFRDGLRELNAYGARLAAEALRTIPAGIYRYEDFMDDDGLGNTDLLIRVAIEVLDGRVDVDFDGTAPQTQGNINCPLSVAAAAVFYVFRCLMPAYTPACHGTFSAIRLRAPEGCLVNARRPAAVAAGNVETSSRIVDVVMGALAKALPERIPAASYGGMNNLAMGSSRQGAAWDYYETIGGGTGGGPARAGLSGVQAHMTNTLNTPIEVLEMKYPLRVTEYALRQGSGGNGVHPGGSGLVREFLWLAPGEATLLTERRRRSPWGLAGGTAGSPGRNLHNGTVVPGKVHLHMAAGDRIRIETPGGGGWGEAPE